MYSTATWTVATDQAVLTVRDHGSPDTPGPCFVLVHGFPDDHHVFDQLLENMAGHRVLTYGTRGSADAELAPGARVDLETLAEDLRQVIASIPGSPEVVLVGHDWGAVQCWAALADPLLAQQVRHHVSIAGPHLDHLRRQARRAALRPGRWRPTARQVARSWYAVALVLRPLQRWTI
ncbi:MAG: alpha/beta fold hydrolase, partial [Actinomycetales bacterium]